MDYLFLDTTNGLTLGLLNNEFEWLCYESIDEKKPSEVIHKKLDAISKNFKIDLTKSTFIIVAGPGSYTGMRLSEGLAHILKICGTKIVSFYHFEIPYLIGIKSGVWITNAFKNQFFLYEWDENEHRNYLMNGADMNFTRSVYSNVSIPIFKDVKLTTQMIYENPKAIFHSIVERGDFLGAYYFRTLDEEFKSTC